MGTLRRLSLGSMILVLFVISTSIAQADRVDDLINQLKNGNWRAQESAVEALVKIGDSRTVESLITVLKDEKGGVRFQAAKALDKLGWEATDDNEKALYFVAKKNWNECAKMGDLAVDPLIAVLTDKDVQYEAVNTLRRIDKGALSRAVDPLIAALKDARIRKSAISALGMIRDPRAVEPLIAMLEYEDKSIKEAAAKALGLIGSQQAVDPVLKLLESKDVDIRTRAIFTLEGLQDYGRGQDKTIKALAQIMLNDPDAEVRSRAAHALGEIGDKRAIKSLKIATRDKELEDKGTEVGYFAKEAIKQIRKRESSNFFYNYHLQGLFENLGAFAFLGFILVLFLFGVEFILRAKAAKKSTSFYLFKIIFPILLGVVFTIVTILGVIPPFLVACAFMVGFFIYAFPLYSTPCIFGLFFIFLGLRNKRLSFYKEPPEKRYRLYFAVGLICLLVLPALIGIWDYCWQLSSHFYVSR